MALQLTKDSIDLGVVVRDADAALAFYRDVVGMEYLRTDPMPGGAQMHRLMCGSSMIKLVSFTPVPDAANPPGGLNKATGYRYFTISVSNLEEVVEGCRAAGAPVKVPPSEIRPGVTIAMVEDPDGNWVEFLQTS